MVAKGEILAGAGRFTLGDGLSANLTFPGMLTKIGGASFLYCAVVGSVIADLKKGRQDKWPVKIPQGRGLPLRTKIRWRAAE